MKNRILLELYFLPGDLEKQIERFVDRARHKSVIIKEFRNGFFPFVGGDIKDFFEELKVKMQPDIVFTHYHQDLHQDHRVIAELTWNTFRDHWVLEYEVPKYDGGLGSPNFFVPSSREFVEKKSDLLLDCYQTQTKRSWFTRSTFQALMRLRGIEYNSETG